MGWKDTLKKMAGAINPTVFFGTGAQIAGDYMAMRAAGQESDDARSANLYMSEEDRKLQREFAQHGLRWRMEDAQRAGIHPLAAMGAQLHSGSPTAIGITPDHSKSTFYSQMGQNISRAVLATQTQNERVATRLNQQRMMLENELLGIQVDQARKQSLGPPFPDQTVETPLTRVAAERDRNWQEVGMYPSVAYMKSPTGLVPIMPPNLAEALESDQSNQIQWGLRYKGGPNVRPTEGPSQNKLPRGKDGWLWDYKLQEWRAVTKQEAERIGKANMEIRRRPRPRRMRFNWMRD